MFRAHTPIIRNHAEALKTTTDPKTRVGKNLFINTKEKCFNHTTHQLPLSNLTLLTYLLTYLLTCSMVQSP